MVAMLLSLITRMVNYMTTRTLLSTRQKRSKDMSTKVSDWAFDEQGLTMGQKLVLIALADNASDEGYCWPGIGHITWKTCMSRRAIQIVCRQLEEKKILRVEKRYDDNGRQKSNAYYLIAPKKRANITDITEGAAYAPSPPEGCSSFIPEGAADARGRGQQMHPNHNIESSNEPSIQDVFDFWVDKTGYTGSIFSDKRKALLKARLKEGFTIERLKTAVIGITENTHNRGDNKSGTVFLSFELIFRNAEKVEQYENNYKDKRNKRPTMKAANSKTCSKCEQESFVLRGSPALCADCYVMP